MWTSLVCYFFTWVIYTVYMLRTPEFIWTLLHVNAFKTAFSSLWLNISIILSVYLYNSVYPYLLSTISNHNLYHWSKLLYAWVFWLGHIYLINHNIFIIYVKNQIRKLFEPQTFSIMVGHSNIMYSPTWKNFLTWYNLILLIFI